MSRRAESGTLPGTYTELKRGRKPCSNSACDVIIGAGRKKCPVCGEVFGAKASQPVTQEAEDGVQRPSETAVAGGGDALEVMLVPAGRCPVKLESTDPEAVSVWLKAVSAWWEVKGEKRVALSLRAVEWWARDFYRYGTPEHCEVVARLREHCGIADLAAEAA